MSTQTVVKKNDFFPSFIDDFFKPWGDWVDNKLQKKLTIPAVNVIENTDGYDINVAAPGLKKADFYIEVTGNILTISAESEKENEETVDENYTRREYNYSSFSRSLTLPDDVDEDKITAAYDGGVLKLKVPKKQGAGKITGKAIAVN